MTPERWQKIRELFHAVLELDSPKRARYLDEACAGDASLRQGVETLLSRHGRAESFLESPVAAGNNVPLSETGAAPNSQPRLNGLLAGQRLGRYYILEKLGSGGMGVVYRARDERLDRDVALKVLPRAVLADEAARKRFRNEALALSRLSHAHIATVYDFDSQEGTDFLVIECVPGTTLAENLAGGSLAEKEAARLGLEVASALEEAHEHRVVHCDLKPANIMVTPKGQAKVLDFGLARLLRAPGEAVKTDTLSLTQSFAGTLPYMAPEQLRGERPDPRTDIWALGAILYEMTTGQLPFPQGQGPPLIAAILNEAPRPPSSINRRISPALESVILKALDKEPENRYQSAKELGVDLRRLIMPASATLVKPAAHARRVRRAAVVVGLAAVLLAIAAGLNLGGWRQRLLGRAAGPHIQSVAVLPFNNMTGDPAQEYFADGMTDALLTELSQIKSLRVISLTSVMQYKGTKKLLPQIGRELNVDAVVEGTVRRGGDQVWITPQLIEAGTDRHLWAKPYERSMREISTLQNQVAQDIVREMRIELTQGEQTRLTSPRRLVNQEAYEAYLLGRMFYGKRDAHSLIKSTSYYEQAIAKDPNYAAAYAGLAQSYRVLAGGQATKENVMPWKEAAAKSRAAALKALELDNNLADAHLALATNEDPAGAERELHRAIELDPGSAEAYRALAGLRHQAGRMEETLRANQHAHELDPLSPNILKNQGIYLAEMQRYDEALQAFQQALVLAPNQINVRYSLEYFYERRNMYPEALAQAQKISELTNGAPWSRLMVAYQYVIMGRRAEAERIVRELKGRATQDKSAFWFALVTNALGHREEALRWLERALVEDALQGIAADDPRFGPLRSDPRYQSWLKRALQAGASEFYPRY